MPTLPFVTRSAHDALQGDNAKLLELLASWKERVNELEKELANTRDQVIDLVAQRDQANAERDDAHEEYTATATRELKAIAERDAIRKHVYVAECARHAADKERDEAQELTIRALVLLQEVDTTRTGGKQLQALINNLLSDARLSGLWGELPTKEDR